MLSGICSDDSQVGLDEPPGATVKLNTTPTIRHSSSQTTTSNLRLKIKIMAGIMGKTKVILEADRPMSKCNRPRTHIEQEKRFTNRP
jgi:hypothetical protein